MLGSTSTLEVGGRFVSRTRPRYNQFQWTSRTTILRRRSVTVVGTSFVVGMC